MPIASLAHRRRAAALLAVLLVVGSALLTTGPTIGANDHLVVSEVVTGGASASDELIELHNPTAAPLPLEGLELVYVSATGATISRRSAWSLGAPQVPPGGHVLVANEAGIYAPIADATYASGMAATGGSVAIRILGAATAIDAVGWGNAASPWREGTNAAAPAAGASIERRPGGSAGSGQDTDDNASDFVERPLPDPQNLASPPSSRDGGSPAPTPMPSLPTPVPSMPTPDPSASSPQPTPTPTGSHAVQIGLARGLPDGTRVTIEGASLTGSAFHDGGGFVADGTGGIAVVVADGTFERGAWLRLSGEVENRFAQRTLRVAAVDLEVLRAGSEIAAVASPTGAVGEANEGTLARVAGTIVGGRTELAAGIAFDVDDGSGPVRVLATAGSGIDVDAWVTGTALTVTGIVGQRDSSGTGLAGYRLMLRDPGDVLTVQPPNPGPSAAPTTAASVGPSASAPAAGTVAIAAARAAERNALVTVRGTVTLPLGVVDAETAVIQDATGAIVLRVADGAGTLRLGELVQVTGRRSTKSGMETLRVTDPIDDLGTGPVPVPRPIRSGDAGELAEAILVVARGGLVASARRSSTGSVSFELDDGSGRLKVTIGAGLGHDPDDLREGTWVEVTGVLGQETTGAAPTSGYRVWPATSAAVRVTASPGLDDGGSTGSGEPDGEGQPPADGLEEVGAPGLGDLRIGATLVAGAWPELGIGGVLWDGSRLVAVDPASSETVAALLAGSRPPLALDLGDLEATGVDPVLGIARVRLGTDPDDAIPAGEPAAPTARPGRDPAWSSMIGVALGRPDRPMLLVPHGRFAIEMRCAGERPRRGLVSVTGVALRDPDRIVVGCGGIRRVPLLAWRDDGPTAGIVPGGLAHGGEPRGTGSIRPLAAGMLGVAALGAGGAAAIARFRRRPDPPDEPDAAAGTDGPAVTEPGPPRLTLVRVPREHGS